MAKVMTNKLAVSVFQFPTGALPTTETGKAKVRLGPTCCYLSPWQVKGGEAFGLRRQPGLQNKILTQTKAAKVKCFLTFNASVFLLTGSMP